MSGHTRLDKVHNENIRENIGVVPIKDKLKEGRLRWFGHAKRKHTETPVKQVEHIRLEDRKKKRGIPKLTWRRVVHLTQNRLEWRKQIHIAYSKFLR